MWLINSSIGRKFVMALTGACLVLFVTFHVLMNAVAIAWPAAYNAICLFLGANWYAVVASMGLALLFIIHIVYAVCLTVQNRRARGADRYAVTSRPPQVEWSSKNMLVLGIVILAFLVVHLIQFWAKMQLQEIVSHDPSNWSTAMGNAANPSMGTLFIQEAFSQVYTPIVYIIGFVALWFHMNHGFWSMFQSCGWNNRVWIDRLKRIGLWWTTIVVGLFIAQAVVFTVQAHRDHYLTDVTLQEQYAQGWNDQAQTLCDDFRAGAMNAVKAADPNSQQAMMNAQTDFLKAQGPQFLQRAGFIDSVYTRQCPDVPSQEVEQMRQMSQFINFQISRVPEMSFGNPYGAGQPQAQPQPQR